MRTPRAIVAAAIVLGGTTGCAAVEAPHDPQALAGNHEAALTELRSTPGVADASFSDSNGRTSDLDVTLDDTVTVAELAVIGDRVEAIKLDAGSDHASHAVELTLGGSSYSYFSGLSGDALDAQLAYWHALVAAGPESVVIADDPVAVPAAAALDATPSASATGPGPRFVLVDLPAVPDQSHLSAMLANLAAIDDPGAPSGQWRFVDLAPDLDAGFARPAFPSHDRLASAMDAGALFHDIEVASIEVNQGADENAPLTISITSFDEAMDGVASAQASGAFQRSDTYAHLLSLIDMLERRAIPAYELSVLSSPLVDGGNFALRLRVDGCTFNGDARWPDVSAAAGAHWLDHVSLKRYPGGDKQTQCTVNVPRVTG